MDVNLRKYVAEVQATSRDDVTCAVHFYRAQLWANETPEKALTILYNGII